MKLIQALGMDIFGVDEEQILRKVMDKEERRKKLMTTCPECGGQLVERTGRYGTFIGCSDPKNGCKYTRNK